MRIDGKRWKGYLLTALKTFKARRRVDSSAVFVILHPVRNNLIF